LAQRRARDTEEKEEAKRGKRVQPVHDELKQAAQPEDSQEKQALSEMTVAEQASLVKNPQVFSAQRAEAVLGLQETYGNRYVQRMVEGSKGATLNEDLIRRIGAQRGSGRPLEPEVRSEMEGAFGQDFSDVHIHTNTEANRLSKELGAKAFTTGKDVFFREGAYQPGSEAGKNLLGHEPTHVVQQESSTQVGQRSIGRIGDAWEQEAALVGQAVSGGHEVSVETTSAVPALQRQAGDKFDTSVVPPGQEAKWHAARRAALKAMFEPKVVKPIKEANKALGKQKPDVQVALLKVETAQKGLTAMSKRNYGVDPMYWKLIATNNFLQTQRVFLTSHLNISAPSLSDIRGSLNSKGWPLTDYFIPIRMGF
jgi:hypothetical protein